MKIAISAATGHFGQLAIQELLKTVAAGDIVAVVRNREKGQRLLPAGITVRQADYTDEVAMTTALAGIDRLLFISSVPGGPVSRQQQHANVVKAAQAAGVSYVAYTSFAKADTAQSPLSKDHVATEALLKASGLQVSFLRNAWYLENELSYLQAGAQGQDSVYVAGDGRIGFALEREYAEAAAKVMTTPVPKPVYEFAGTPVTYAELAATLQTVTGQAVTFKAVSDDTYRQDMREAGVAPELVEVLLSMQIMMRAGELDVTSSDLADVLGRPVTPLATAIREILAR
ncbi:NAD(P)-dependent oxidoreductase [Levilactobacillus brevis]|uniref:NAD(P)-dependent oxidoreductase n=1 Tax=Levilactobacillus brevis TaxID=1580 RepID=A0A2A3U1S7_LEVBR|nr:SDR family oxidoreductase [Levilactobacillus brevis]PBQ24898.1 NAD(P)-dependent oxidoreductase [Levilactobacillus brevis]